ncbi:MAG: hypothetical protein DME44_13105 [Verrucomicrobia bacterium]|nr:MAG: hypothetical protein DME44_13105 [Verrucomicrobiota bacterium]
MRVVFITRFLPFATPRSIQIDINENAESLFVVAERGTACSDIEAPFDSSWLQWFTVHDALILMTVQLFIASMR